MEYPGVLIDTTILIDHFRKIKKEESLFYKYMMQYNGFISSITEFEFYVGSSEKTQQFVQELISMVQIIPFDSSCVDVAWRLYQDLKAQNKLISVTDILIAATAIRHEMPLLTLNRKHFERIENLQVYSN